MDGEIIENINNSLSVCLQNNKELKPIAEYFSKSLATFCIKFKEYELEPDYENFCKLLYNLDVTYSSDIESFSEYDKENNNLKINMDRVKQVNDPKKLSRIFNLPLLNMLTTVYVYEMEKKNNGITFEKDGKVYGQYINEKLNDRIIELFFGNEEENQDEYNPFKEPITLPTASDQLHMDMETIVGSSNIFTYYLNGRGDLFFMKMTELFNLEEDCLNFLRSTEDLRNPTPKQEEEYNRTVEILVERRSKKTARDL